MQIRFKNKMTMGIINMIEQGRKLGGLPAVIELSVEEATHLINEINTLRSQQNTQHGRFRFKMDDIDCRLSFVGKQLTDHEKFTLLTDWTQSRIQVTFDGVPLRIIINIPPAEKQYHELKI